MATKKQYLLDTCVLLDMFFYSQMALPEKLLLSYNSPLSLFIDEANFDKNYIEFMPDFNFQKNSLVNLFNIYEDAYTKTSKMKMPKNADKTKIFNKTFMEVLDDYISNDVNNGKNNLLRNFYGNCKLIDGKITTSSSIFNRFLQLINNGEIDFKKFQDSIYTHRYPATTNIRYGNNNQSIPNKLGYKFCSIVEKYKENRQLELSGILLEKMIEGTCELCIPEVSSLEFINLINTQYKGKFTTKQIQDFFKSFKILSCTPTQNKEVLSLSKDFRQSISNPPKQKIKDLSGDDKLATPMKKDLNSLDMPADSYLAAFSNYFGIPLITHNVQDFIESKQNNKLSRRKHILDVGKSTTTPLSIFEYFDLYYHDKYFTASDDIRIKTHGFKKQTTTEKSLDIDTATELTTALSEQAKYSKSIKSSKISFSEIMENRIRTKLSNHNDKTSTNKTQEREK